MITEDSGKLPDMSFYKSEMLRKSVGIDLLYMTKRAVNRSQILRLPWNRMQPSDTLDR